MYDSRIVRGYCRLPALLIVVSLQYLLATNWPPD